MPNKKPNNPIQSLTPETKENTMKNILKKSTVNAVVGALTLSLLSACGTVTQPSYEPVATLEELKKRTCTFPDVPGEQAPAWVCKSEVEGLVSGTGSYPPSAASYNHRFQTAQMRARADMANKFSLTVRATIKSYESEVGQNDAVRLSQLSETFSQSLQQIDLPGTRVYDSITSPKGTLYVLVGVDEQVAKLEARMQVQKVLGNESASDVEARIHQQMHRLNNEVDNQSDRRQGG